MVIVRVVLALPDASAGWALSQLAPHRELRLVAQVQHELELMYVLQTELARHPQSPDDPLVLITAPGWGGGEASCTRLVTEFTDLIAYDVAPQGITRYHMDVDIQTRRQATDIFSDLRALAARPALQVVQRGPEELDR